MHFLWEIPKFLETKLCISESTYQNLRNAAKRKNYNSKYLSREKNGFKLVTKQLEKEKESMK